MKISIKIYLSCVLHLLFITANGQKLLPDSMIIKTIDGINVNKQIPHFNADEQETIRNYYVWDNNAGNWRDYMQFNYEYDYSGNQTMDAAFMADSATGQWIGLHKINSVFDKHGNETEKTYYSWNNHNREWINNYKYAVKFDKSGNKISDIAYMGVDNKWYAYEKGNKYEHVYDNYGNVLQSIKYKLENSEPAEKYEYEYDTDSNLIGSTLFRFTEDNSWKGNNRYEYQYDSNGRQIMETHFMWTNNEWQPHYKYGHTYSNSGNLTAMFFSYWDKVSHTWIGKYYYQYMYDHNSNPLSIDLHIWSNDNWLHNEIATYYYSKQKLSAPVHTSDELSVIVYPNPTTNYITIAGAEKSDLIIFDSQGRIIYSRKNIENEETIQTASWVTGAYFVALTYKDKRITRKIIKII